VWEAVLAAQQAEAAEAALPVVIPEQVIALVSQRQDARSAANWSMADHLRQKVQELGWTVTDTPDGPVVQPRI
jgi:cysteinyl-tRNA synthetase